MANPKGYIDIQRKNGQNVAVEKRIKHFGEFAQPLPYHEMQQQGERCIDCGTPFCNTMGCPIENLIPEWNDLVSVGNWKEAYHRLELTNNFPEVTSRVCPAPCESACTLAFNEEPVTIKSIERAIIDKAFEENWVKAYKPEVERTERVAIIGSGPAGLACAQELKRAGFQVTVYERDEEIGGLMRYGIPDFKLEKRWLDVRIELMQEEGVVFETGISLGEDMPLEWFQKRYDAVALCMGAQEPRDMDLPGRDLGNVHHGLDYLAELNRSVKQAQSDDEIITSESVQSTISAKGKVVVVLGGGDTGSDCVGSANRQGARKVYQIAQSAKPLVWQGKSNPHWPNVAKIVKTEASHEEGCERLWGLKLKEFVGDAESKTVRGIKLVEMQTSKPHPAQPPVTTEKEGSEYILDVDMVLLAKGFLHVEHFDWLTQENFELDTQGNIKRNAQGETSQKGVFACGDACLGPSLVVTAIQEGRTLAQQIGVLLQKNN